jgi:catechol 2,3-dioxygenase-like lactoylglutathione lyase family enzyme
MDKDALKNGPFSKLHHISIVVRDAEKTQKFYESIGIGPWVDYPPMKEYVNINVPDEKGFYNLKIKSAQIGPVQLQMIEPGEGESLYKDHLKKKGEGVYHIGFEVDNIDATDAKIEAMNLKVLSSGRRANGSGFSYLKTAVDAGVVLLVRQSPPAK